MSPRQSNRYHPDSPPHTPPRNAKYKTIRPRDLNLRPPFPETFLEDMSPAERDRAADSGDEEGDPHDLSLSPQHGARTSVVDNMLLSLDQFSESNFDPGREVSQDADPYALYARYSTSKFGRHRGHTFSSSLSSDVEQYPEENVGGYHSQSNRGRRSNSNSNYPPTIRRVDSSNGGPEKLSNRTRIYQSQRATNPTDRGNQQHRYLRKESRGSESSSLDLGQMLSGTRTGKSRRSASFDYGTDMPRRPAPDSRDAHGQDNGWDFDDINAAPNPTVPAGPRKNRSTATFKESENSKPGSANTQPRLAHKASSKSTRSMYVRKGRSDTLGTATIRGRPDDYKIFDEGDVPPVPDFFNSSAPSPTIARHKTSYLPSPIDNAASSPLQPSLPPSQSPSQSPSQPTSQPPSQAPTKERYGFFRRMFGSSKSSTPSQTEPVPPHSRGNESPSQSSGHHSAPSSSKGNRPLPNDHPLSKQTDASREKTPVVTKKPSSFFRRRKKSTTDHVPPPLVLPQSNIRPVDIPKGDPLKPPMMAEPSPISSLRNVMKPYLSDPNSPGLQDSQRSHQPSAPRGTEPSRGEPDKTSRARRSTWKTSPAPVPQPPHSVNAESNTNSDRGIPVWAGGASFLADSSEPEGLPRKYAGNDSRRPMTSPAPHTGKLSIHPPEPLPDRGLHGNPSSKKRHDGPTKLALDVKSTDLSPRESGSTISNYHTASNTPVSAADNDAQQPRSQPVTSAVAPEADADQSDDPGDDTLVADPGEPDSGAKKLAERLFNESDDEAMSEPVTASWLGHPDRAQIRKEYIDLFDWANMNILVAMRSLCSKMTLKGETQQVDRVLDAFSCRWCDCNPNHGFKATDVVHTICYSLILLNTDLHVADLDQKMTRPQFIKNTMPTIQRVVLDAAPDAFENKPHPPRISADENAEAGRCTTPVDKPNTNVVDVKSKRLSTFKPDFSAAGSDPAAGGSGLLVNKPFSGTQKSWETQVESVLKEFYNSIQKHSLPLRGAENVEPQPSSNNFLSVTGNMLRRTPSTISKASDAYPRGRQAESKLAAARWASKPRSRARIYPASTMASSRTSLDDQSIWSPSASSTWSKNSLGKTLTSLSVDSLGSENARGDYQQSIGFANALSHAIIREESSVPTSGMEDPSRESSLLEDESLELVGAPWAKEGSLKHKHHLDSADKRAKDRNWNESFAVIQRGWMRLFSFNMSTKSMRMKQKQRQQNAVVGAGNWMENAEETAKFLLRHTIASALPHPGYSKTRPYVWALSLPTGGVHLFQVGTPEIIKEFVSAANYWSARLSKEPMSGGISNIEYGWSDAIIGNVPNNVDDQKPPSVSGPRPSLQSSIRSSFDQQSVRPRLPADKVHISDWKPPQQSMIGSTLSEAKQLESLRSYVKNVEADLQLHNNLRPALALAFTPRHSNANKALSNWERKSSFLLREIVKFRTYIDCLQAAQVQKEKHYASIRPAKPASTDEQTQPAN